MEIAQSERKKGRAAHVKIVGEPRAAVGRHQPRSGGPMQRGKAHDQSHGPDRQETDQRERTINREKSLAAVVRIEHPGEVGPGLPAATKIESRQSNASSDGAWQKDCLECIPEDDGNERQASEHDGAPRPVLIRHRRLYCCST